MQRMTEDNFNQFWENNYPDCQPINHQLKNIYQDRWFRIHSLPESKRYAENDKEYELIYKRQAKLFDDLIGEGENIYTTFGQYELGIENKNYSEIIEYKSYKKVKTINLHLAYPDDYEEDFHFQIFVKVEKWNKKNKRQILLAIADDKIRAMFVCPNKKCIVAPYDGGIDIIVENQKIRDIKKQKYQNWLSKREDGL